MTIDVSTILKELGGKIDINGDVEMSDTDFLGEMYHFNEPVKVSGSVSNNGKSLILKANCTGHMTTQCARRSILFSLPMKVVCSEDCKGLCQHCGADLNEGDCGCSQENIDPRWAALVDIMEKDK